MCVLNGAEEADRSVDDAGSEQYYTLSFSNRRSLAKVHGNDKGVVPPIESQQAASILRTIEEKPQPAADID